MLLNSLSIRERSGPEFLHLRRRTVAAWGGVLLDDLPPHVVQLIRGS